MFCEMCGQEVGQGASFCPNCGARIAQETPGADWPVYQADVRRVLRSGTLVVYRDRTEFVTGGVQRSVFHYAGLAAVKKEWDHIDFITEDGRRESCPADTKCVHEAFLHIERMAGPYLVQRKERLLAQGIRYSFPSSQGMLNDGILNLSDGQAEFRGKSGMSEIISFQDVKSVGSFSGALDFVLFNRQTRSFAVSAELRDEVLAFLAAAIAPYLARRREALLARGIYFSFPAPDGGTIELLADRAERRDPAGQTEAVFFRGVRAANVFDGTLELALTDGTSRFFPIDVEAGNEVLLFVKNAIEPFVRARTEGFDASFGLDEQIEINRQRGVFHIIRQSGREITGEWPLAALAECRWEERLELNALGNAVSGGIALFKTAARATGNLSVGETEERLSCAGVTMTLLTEQGTWTQSVWFGLFPAGMGRSNKKYEQYLAEWFRFSEQLRTCCPECQRMGPALPEPAVQRAESGTGMPETPLAAGSPNGGTTAGPVMAPGAAPPQDDDLGIARYLEGISRFIGNCSTPMTIAFQGNRGSGENNILRILFNRMMRQGGNFQLWFNVRQFSQGESGPALSTAIGKKLVGLFGDEDEAAGKGGELISNLAGLLTGTVAGDSSIGKDMVGGLFNKRSADSPEQLAELFARKAAAQGGAGKVVLFIDGLEWIVPARAVELLEAMRAFFACRGCVFVVATDYSAVLSGVRERYGQSFDENRIKTFFDEMFKMSFRVPESSYNVQNYVKSKLEQLGIRIENEADLELCVSLVESSVGKDLESIDRLFTSFQLIKDLADEELYKSRYSRQVLFALLCMQTGFRKVYDCVMQRKDSITTEFLAGLCGFAPQSWDEGLVSDEEKEAFQDFGGVFARIINLDGDAEISEAERRAFVEVLEYSSITSK